jgi:hypothetical protein
MFFTRTLFFAGLLPLAASSTACILGPGTADTEEPALAILGGTAHDLSAMTVEVLLTADDGLDVPRDLALHPENRDELWIVNEGDSSVTIAFALGSSSQVADKRNAPGNTHFMPRPSALAFGDNGFMATAHEEDQITQPTTPADFMGPTLWTSDEATFDGGHASHMDMMHNSPAAMGIAWERDNAYWVFDGHHASITRYDFGDDHGPGGADHSDGVVERAVEGEVERVPGVPSHLELDHDTGLLYVADTGHHRIVAIDTASGVAGRSIGPNYDGGIQRFRDDVTLTVVAESDGEEVFLQEPSGLALHDGLIFVSDFASGEIQAFEKDGTPRGFLQTELEDALMGIEFDDEGRLLVIDSAGQRILRLSPKS